MRKYELLDRFVCVCVFMCACRHETCISEEFMHDIVGRHDYKIPFIGYNKDAFYKAHKQMQKGEIIKLH